MMQAMVASVSRNTHSMDDTDSTVDTVDTVGGGVCAGMGDVQHNIDGEIGRTGARLAVSTRGGHP